MSKNFDLYKSVSFVRNCIRAWIIFCIRNFHCISAGNFWSNLNNEIATKQIDRDDILQQLLSQQKKKIKFKTCAVKNLKI